MTDTSDQTLVCRDCKATFVFTAGEQAFFAERQFTPPTRCKTCRQARKAAKEGGQAPAPVGSFTPSGGYTTGSMPRDSGGYPPPQTDGRKRSGGGGRRRKGEDQDW